MTNYKTIKGNTYEDFVLNNLLAEYDVVYHFKETPEYIIAKTSLYNNYNVYLRYKNCDIGCDLVAVKNDIVYFIQCKNFNGTISINDFCSFYFLILEYNLNGIVYYNGTLSERLLDLKQNKIPYINLPYNNTIIDINFINNENNLIVTRDYQLDIYNKFIDINRGIISLPCGMGKTFCSYLIGKDYDNLIIVSPTRALSESNLVNLYKYSNNVYNPILISTDGTRKVNEIINIIKDKNIFSVTYDSVNIINKIINDLSNKILFIDEYHNLSKPNLESNKNEMNKLLTSDIKTIFLSATPIKNNYPDILGDFIYNYDWNTAIINKYICDFKIILPENTTDIFDDLLKNINYNETNKLIILKCYFILKSIIYYGNKKTIIYTTSIDEAVEYNKIISWLQQLLNVSFESNIINCHTSKINRIEYIKKFKFSLVNQILLNVQILNEGIDIPECDSVFITKPSENIINLVQRMCRCNRIQPNKNFCYIYLWCDNKIVSKINNYLDAIDNLFHNKIEYYNTINNTLNNTINNNSNIKITDIIKTTTNSTNFITEFYNIIKENYTEKYNEFLIDSEILREILQINNRRIFNDTIKRSYIKDIDYRIEKVKKSSGSGGHNLEVITLTPQSVKKICFSSKSKISKQVQQYFIDCELSIYCTKINTI